MHVGIIGYGKMGAAIFRLLAGKPFKVTVFFRTEEKARSKEEKYFRSLERSRKRGSLTGAEFSNKKQTLKFTHRWADLALADLVIETASEDYEAKAAIFSRLESVVDKNTALVTNTSSISIKKLANELKYKKRFCGLHFFFPVLIMNLVEIIKWKNTSDEIINILRNFCTFINKKYIVVVDGPASVINTILCYYYTEALYILEEGIASPTMIDQIAKKFFYIGPCESLDVIGIDFFINGIMTVIFDKNYEWLLTKDFQTELSSGDSGGREGFHVPYLFRKLLSENRLGKKVSRGIYLYDREKPLDDKPEFYLNPALVPKALSVNHIEGLIEKRLIYSIFNGCLYSYRQKKATLEDLDFALKEVLHMQEGPFTLMKGIGYQRVKKEFESLTEKVGTRFRQTNLDFF
jgi:3-hydroxybutyryl-CoA dehydrogenase